MANTRDDGFDNYLLLRSIDIDALTNDVEDISNDGFVNLSSIFVLY